MKFNKNNFKNQTEEVLYILQNRKSVRCIDFILQFGIIRYPVAIFNLRHWHTADWSRYTINMTEKKVKMWNRIQRQTVYSLEK